MLSPSAGPEDHHRRVETLVRGWLQERQSLIVQMMGLTDPVPGDSVPLAERLQAFCEVLMDYVSAGYFEVYDELLAEGEAGPPVLRVRGDQPAAPVRELLGRAGPAMPLDLGVDLVLDAVDDHDISDAEREQAIREAVLFAFEFVQARYAMRARR